MLRRAFLMRLKPGALDEYKRNHDHIWPELVAAIKASGIATMTIFEQDPLLIMYSEIADEKAWDELWHSQIHDRWAEVMNPLMEFRADGLVDSQPVTEIFHLE
jgi:L-rhamnose mutarotase